MIRNIFIDCGAWEGDSTKLFIEKYKDNLFESFVFECEPRLKEKLAKLSRSLNFNLIFKAVSTRNGPICFYQGTGGFTESSSIIESKTTNINKVSYVEAEAVDFSAWIIDNFKIEDFIVCKMNIEGAEYDVLERMILDGSIYYIDILYVEWHNTKMKGVSQERHDTLKSDLSKVVILRNWKFSKKYKTNPFNLSVEE